MSTDVKFLQQVVVKLWEILDNIDNYAELNINDTDENNPFRNICHKASERFKYVHSDGYNLFIGDECIDDGKGICIDERQDIQGRTEEAPKRGY